MLCEKPYRQGSQEFPCYVCLPCRINRKRLWTGRLLLEQMQHDDSCFITLTFDEDHIASDFSLHPEDLRNWLKRLRSLLAPVVVRFFAVGEYGDISGRPHYHVVLFGFRPVDHVSPQLQKKLHRRCTCAVCRSWLFGDVDVGNLTPESAAYTAGYLMKYMTKKWDERLEGRHPEFTRMSLRPGIGADAVGEIVRFLSSEEGAKYVSEHHRIPSSIRCNGRRYPIGRYLGGLVLSGLGYPDFRLDSLRARADLELEVFKALPDFEARDLFRRQRQLELDQREVKREVQARNALARVRIAASRKGYGI